MDPTRSRLASNAGRPGTPRQLIAITADARTATTKTVLDRAKNRLRGSKPGVRRTRSPRSSLPATGRDSSSMNLRPRRPRKG